MRKTVSWLVIYAIWTSVFAPFAQNLNAQKRVAATTANVANMNQTTPDGLQFRLSEGVEGAEQREKQQLAATNPLSDSETGGILKRLPEIKADKDDQTEFKKRVGSLPAPKTGEKIPVKFPADEQRGTPKIDNSQALQVVRFTPEGAVSLAPDLTVTFSQAMVAVTSQEEAAQTVPVEFSPALPEGKWRWLGTKTLMFDTKSRFPMATKFTARIPAGTKSATGQTLQKDVVWTFTTPPPKVETMIPQNQTTRRDALIYISFDQAVNAEAVLKTITVKGGNAKIPVRLATQAEIDADANISYYAKKAQPNRWLAFRAVNSDGLPENALPPATQISVVVEKGTASAEGPLTTTVAQSFSFSTYGAMKFVNGYCGYDENKKICAPYDSFQMNFSNQIDAAAFDKSIVKIEPNIEGVKIYPSGGSIVIEGYKPARKTFTVTVAPGLKDIYGQTTTQEAKVVFKTGAADQTFSGQGGNFVVLDPNSKPAYSIYTTNQKSVSVKIYQVQPTDWSQFQEYVRRINYDDSTKKPQIPGKLISDKTVNVAAKADELTETRIDLSEYLNGGFGNLILDIEPTIKQNKYDRERVFKWLEATNIGLDAFVDNEELVGLATDLKTGKPLSGVSLSIAPNGKELSENINQSNTENNSSQSWLDWAYGWFAPTEKTHGPSATDESGAGSVVENIEKAQTNQTAANGILRLGLPDGAAKTQNILIARRGKDIAFLPENADYYWQEAGNWYKKSTPDSLRWSVFNDRNMYRPKEEVSVKGYIRVYEGGKLGDVQPLGDKASGITYTVFDSRGNQIGKGATNLNVFGAFDFKFKLPDNANLGYSRVDISTSSSLGNSATSMPFQIQEFRRPEFEVKAKNETEAPYFVKDSANVSVEAKYFAGGGLANAETNWVVTATPTNYTPPNRGDYTFGTFVPWWRSYNNYNRYGSNSTSQSFKGTTDASGKHVLKIDFESVNPARPYTVTANASVQDVNRQTWASSTSLLVHPSLVYVGIKSSKNFVQKGENVEIESIVTDIDGNLIADKNVQMKAVLKDWTFDKGEWKETVVDEQTCEIKSAKDAQKCVFVAKQGGVYTITARVSDDRERPNESELTVWVPGGKSEPKRDIEKEEAQIIPNKKDFAPGDTAELLVISPFANAEVVLTLRRDGIVKTERFTVKDSSIVLKIPLDAKYLPNIYAQVDLVGVAERTNDKGEIDAKLPKRPAFASGQINLPIATDSRKLTVTADAQDKTLEPGGATKINVEVKDDKGNAVSNSEVAVVAVDESILALSNYSIADPLGAFYTQRGDGVTDYHSRDKVLLGNPDDAKIAPPPPPPPSPAMSADMEAGAARSAPMSMMKSSNDPHGYIAQIFVGRRNVRDEGNSDSNNNVPIAVRQNFDALAIFAPSVKTDANGKATIDLKLPDNLTRYRITAVAVDAGKRFGKSESNLTARQPLMVRPSAPRFMNFGDKVELPVVVQNQTDKDLTVNVAVRATNAELTGGGGKSVIVKANDRAEVRFPVSAVKAGTARFQIAVSSGKYADAAEIELPVYTPATTEAFATYGTTDQNGAIFQPVTAPTDVFPQFGGLEVTTSSTQLQELTDAFIYLQTYPFECSEQVSSRMISVAALQDVLKAFKAKEMPTDEALKARFAKDIEILKSRQNADGYFGLWKQTGERYKYPFVTAHVAHSLILAKAKGYAVPDEMLTKVKPYLKNIETHYETYYPEQVRWTISAYALYVRNLMGDKDAAKAKKLLAEATIEKMPFEALGWILSTLADDKNSTAIDQSGYLIGSGDVLSIKVLGEPDYEVESATVNEDGKIEVPFVDERLAVTNRTTKQLRGELAKIWGKYLKTPQITVSVKERNNRSSVTASGEAKTSSPEVEQIKRFLLNRTTETAAAANFVTDYADGAWLIMASNRRADGVLLEAMLKADPNNDLVPKLVRGLLDQRTKGRWENTQENVFILLALDKYFQTYEKVTPDFTSKIWLGNVYAGEQIFKGRSVDSNQLSIPMNYLIDQGGNTNLILDKQGAGRLYYRIGLNYAPKNLNLKPADYGFEVLRKYEAVDDAADVVQNADGSWTIKSGARVRVRLTMVAQARRYHVALVDNLPAGLEILNPELATTEAIPQDTQNTPVIEYGSKSYGFGYYNWRGAWFEHQNFRDERAEAFTSLLWEGVYNYSYVTRATTPGTFVVPPAKAEEMYHPETFGRTGTDFVNVK